MRDKTVITVGISESTVESIRQLQEEGERSYTLVAKTGGDEAVGHLNKIDCLVCTQILPNTTGLDLLSRVRDRKPTLPFVLIVADGSEKLAQKAIRRNVTDYVQNPGEETAFADRIRKAIERTLSESDDDGISDFEQYQQAVEHAAQSIYITNSEGIIEYVNPAFEELLGYSREEAVGQTPSLFHPNYAADPWWHRMWSEQPRQGKVTKQRKSGELITLDQTVAPMMNDGRNRIEYFVVVQRDMTNREARRQHLKVLNRVFRHNVRNSLTKILSVVSLPNHSDRADLKTQLEFIESAADNLLSLSETACDINRLLLDEQIKYCSINVNDMLEKIISKYRSQYPGAEISFRHETETVLKGHPLIEQGFCELIENAIEHADSSKPQVEVVVVEERENRVVIRIEDDGCGIPSLEAKILTGNLDITKLNHGSGLGLWLVYWSVTKSGGDISIPRADETGTTIEVAF